MNIRRINRRLKKRFGPAVTATLTDGCIVLSGHLPAWAETVEACSLAAEKYSTTHVVNEIRCDENRRCHKGSCQKGGISQQISKGIDVGSRRKFCDHSHHTACKTV